jgi:hypothetical protein
MPHLERTTLDFSEKQSQSKKIFDPLKDSFTCSNSLPKECEQNRLLETPSIEKQGRNHDTENIIELNKGINRPEGTRSDLSDLSVDDRNSIDQCIRDLQSEIASHEFGLEKAQNSLERFHGQVLQWKEKKKQYTKILEETDKKLKDYARLVPNSLRFSERKIEKIDEKIEPLLAKFDPIEQKIIDLTKEQDKRRQAIQKKLDKLLKASQLLDERLCEKDLIQLLDQFYTRSVFESSHTASDNALTERLRELKEQMQEGLFEYRNITDDRDEKSENFIIKLVEMHKQMQEQMWEGVSENQPLLDNGGEWRKALTEGLGELLESSQLLGEREKERKALIKDLKKLREEIQKASVTPTDQLYIQYEKCKLAHRKVQAICDKVEKKLKKYSSDTTPGAQKSEAVSLPDVAQICHLREQIQKLVNKSSRCPHELQEKVKSLQKKVESLHQEAIKTQQLYDQIKTDAETLSPKQMKFFRELQYKIQNYILRPEKYNPYYPIERVDSWDRFDIDSTLPGPCAIKTTRRGLSKLGIDIHSKATEEEVVRLAEYPSIAKRGGVSRNKIFKPYSHYLYDYKYYQGWLTIDEIERITNQGHVIDVGVFKPGIGGHSLLIEKVERRIWSDNCIKFYDPFNDQLVTLPYKELKKVLTGCYTLPSKRQRETLKPILKAQGDQ